MDLTLTLAFVVAHPDDDAYGIAGTVALHAADPPVPVRPGPCRIPPAELAAAVAAVLEEEQPTVVGTFGPDGVFGHPDHIAIGAATDAAFMRHASDSGLAFRRLLHGAVPQSVFERWNRQRAARGLAVFDPTAMYHMRGVPDEEIGVEVDCTDVTDRIVAGLQEHRSQLHVMSDDPTDTDRWRRVVATEWAVVAWPPRGPDQQRLRSVFEGLP